MKPEFLESTEFYNRRYHNFSSRVILPMSLLLVFLLGFAVFAEKEISLSTRATVEPSRIIANIQSTSNQRIVANYLEENKLVKQGELLVEYQQGAEAVQAEAYASQLEMLKDQKKQLGYLQSSLKEGSDQFQRRISLVLRRCFEIISAKRMVSGAMFLSKMRPSRPRMQQLVRLKPKSATSSVKQRIKFETTKQLSQRLKKEINWIVRI